MSVRLNWVWRVQCNGMYVYVYASFRLMYIRINYKINWISHRGMAKVNQMISNKNVRICQSSDFRSRSLTDGRRFDVIERYTHTYTNCNLNIQIEIDFNLSNDISF